MASGFSSRRWAAKDNKMMDTNLALAGDTIDSRLKVAIPVKAGRPDDRVTFVAKSRFALGRHSAARAHVIWICRT